MIKIIERDKKNILVKMPRSFEFGLKSLNKKNALFTIDHGYIMEVVEPTVSEKRAIERGLKDIREGKVTSFEEIKKEYGF